MRLTKRYSIPTYVGAAALVALVGCGGGGGGGSSDPYTGSTDAAVITTTNGGEIAKRAYDNGSSSSALSSVFASVQVEPSGLNGEPAILHIGEIARARIESALSASDNSLTTRAIVSQTDTAVGDCGGSSTTTISADDQTGEFSGSVSFSNYCEGGVTVNGSMSVSGTVGSGNNSLEASLTISSLSMISATESVTASGRITMTIGNSLDTATITANLVLVNNSTGKSYKAENLVVTSTTVSGGTELTSTGRFYLSDYGYVDVTTPTPMFIATLDEYPSSGTFVVTGAAGNKATLTATSNTNFQIDIDLGGNGSIDQSYQGTWGSDTLTQI